MEERVEEYEQNTRQKIVLMKCNLANEKRLMLGSVGVDLNPPPSLDF